MYRPSIIKITLALLLISSPQYAMEQLKPIIFGLGSLASLGLVYLYAKQSEPAIKIVPEHTPGENGKPDHYLLFSLCKTEDSARIGSINATYNPVDHTAILQFIQVFKEYQQHGYGVQLWNTMIHELKKYSIRTLTWRVLPIGIHDVTSKDYKKELETRVNWYAKRGGKIVKRYATHVDMMREI